MSAPTGARFHIPFPTNFLSLNTVSSKAAAGIPNSELIASPDESAPHSFLSNRSVSVPRHASISSVDSTGSSSGASSSSSAPSSPAAKTADSPVLRSAFPAFLPLNSKYAAVPGAKGEVKESPFLSNRA